jgi:hypothetical protein
MSSGFEGTSRTDEADLDDEPDHCLDGGQRSDRIAQTLQRLEEATPVEAAHAQGQRLVPGQWRERGGRRQAKGGPACRGLYIFEDECGICVSSNDHRRRWCGEGGNAT